MNSRRTISCAILAGGKGSRLNGENKAMLRIGERNNLQNVMRMTEDIFDERMLITNHPDLYADCGDLRIHTDIFKGVGPLGGMHAALAHARGEAVFFLPCDMPFINRDLVIREIDEYFHGDCEILIPRIGGLIEPLHSIFSAGLAGRLHDHLRNSAAYAIRGFFDLARVRYWDLEDSEDNRRAFFNVNTRHDIERAMKLA